MIGKTYRKVAGLEYVASASRLVWDARNVSPFLFGHVLLHAEVYAESSATF